MNKYLIEILKNHSSLILPGIGALMVTNKKTGEIKFNPHLTFNDGALASFIANEEGIDKVEAQNKVAKFTSEIKLTVDKGETYDIFEFGTIFKDKNGDMAFEMADTSDKTSATKAEEKTPKPKKVTPKSKAVIESPVSKAKDKPSTVKDEKTKESVKSILEKSSKTINDTKDKSAKIVEDTKDSINKIVKSETKKETDNSDTKKDIKNTYIPPSDKDKLPEVPKIVASESKVETSQKEVTKESVTTTAEYTEVKKRRWWPIILLLLLIGLAIAAYFFRDKVKTFLGWDDKTKLENVNNYPDADKDGIPDFADVDLTMGTDEDGDGIDDLADLDYTHGKDEDGDGIDDVFAAQAMSATNDIEEVNPLDMTDEDGDGIPDYADINSTDGTDSNNNGVDDRFDAAITLGSDLNKDCIDDSLANIALLDHLRNQMDDADEDGIPDYADIDLTKGEDINKNGIDDAFESIEMDKNGDGLNDSMLIAMVTNGSNNSSDIEGNTTEEETIDNISKEEIVDEEDSKMAELEKPEPEPVSNTVKTSSTGYNATGNYHAIGAAFSEKSNAENYTSDMSGKGFDATIIGRFDGLYLVSLKQYNRMDEAKSDLSNIRSSSSSGSAWIFRH